MTRQNFIDAEVAKVGSMKALESKYGISESIIETWIDTRAWFDLNGAKLDLQEGRLNDDEAAQFKHNAKLITRGLNRLDRAYIKAGGRY